MLRFTSLATSLRAWPRKSGRHAATEIAAPDHAAGPQNQPPLPRDTVAPPAAPLWLSSFAARLQALADWGEQNPRERSRLAAAILGVAALAGGTYVFVSLPDGHPEKVWQQEDYLVFDQITHVEAEDVEPGSAVPSEASHDTLTTPTDPFLTLPQATQVAASPAVARPDARSQLRLPDQVANFPAQPSATATIQSAFFQPEVSAHEPRGAWLVGTIETTELSTPPSHPMPSENTGGLSITPRVGQSAASTAEKQPVRTAANPAALATPAAPGGSGPLLVPRLNPLSPH